MSDTSAIKGPIGATQAASQVNSPSVKDTLQGLAAEFPYLTKIIEESKISVGRGFTRLSGQTSRQEVGAIAAKLAQGMQLDTQDVTELTAIANDPTKKGSASATRVLEANSKIVPMLESILNELTKLSDKAKTSPLTKDDLASLKLIPPAQLFKHGSAELIQKYGETLDSQNGEMNTFAKNFTESQKTKTGFTDKYNKAVFTDKYNKDVFKMALEYAVKTGGDPSNFMRLNPLYYKLATARVSHYTDSSKMVTFSKNLIKSLETKTKLSTAITGRTVTPKQGAEIATVVSKFFTTSIATLTLSPEYVDDLTALLAEVDTHFKTRQKTAEEKIAAGTEDIAESKITPKDIALIKFRQFTSNYMLRNFNPLLIQKGSDGKTSPVGLYLSKITQNAANMVLFGNKEAHVPITLNTAVLTGIDSLLAMGVENGLFTKEEAPLITEEIADLKVKAAGLKPQMPPSPASQ